VDKERTTVGTKSDLVQALRGVAVSMVVLFHFTKHFPNGFIGVDIFFVISGFVLAPQFNRLGNSNSLETLYTELKFFVLRRFYRLFPALIFVLGFTLIFLSFVADAKTVIIAIKQSIFAMIGIANLSSYSLSGDYFNPEPNVLIHLWSLSAEIQIYAFYSLLILLFYSLRMSVVRMVLFVNFLCLTILLSGLDKLIYGSLGIQNPNLFLYYSPLTHLWQFTLGFFIAILVKRYQEKANRIAISAWPICAIFLFSAMVPEFPVLQSILPIFTALLLFATNLTKGGKLYRLLLWLGDRSYSTYLVHLPIFYIVDFILVTFALESAFLTFLFSGILTLIVSQITFLKIEKKFRLSNDAIKKAFPFMPLGVLVSSSILAGSAIFYLNSLANDGPRGSSENIEISDCQALSTPISLSCRFGNGEKRVLVVGDSHAGALGSSLKKLLVNTGTQIDFAIETSCPFFTSDNFEYSSSCEVRNLEIRKLIKKVRYDLVFSTLRNPMHKDWTPGISSLPNYDLKNIIAGINFISANSGHHFYFLPNSELTSKTILRRLLSPDLSIRRPLVSTYEDVVRNSKVTILSTDLAICESPVCTFYQLEQLLGADGNHLNDIAGARFVNFLARILESVKFW
jgi:peptidoglycan/LPS O-acetylase OafA/YrhL